MSVQDGTDSEVSVPMGVVEKLKKLPGGIETLIKELITVYEINAIFEKGSLIIKGHSDIIDIALELLKSKVNIDSQKSSKSLAGKGRVAWTFQGKEAKYINSFFVAEQEELWKIDSVKIVKSNANDVVISYKYSCHDEANKILNDLEEKIKKCKEKSINLDVKETDRARTFEKEVTIQTNFRCILDDKNPRKPLLSFVGRSEKDCEDGISKWEMYKNEKTKTTWYTKGAEPGSDQSKESETSDQKLGATPKNPTATTTYDPNINRPGLDATSSDEKATPITMDADWDNPENDNSNKPKSGSVATQDKHKGASMTELKDTPVTTTGVGFDASTSAAANNSFTETRDEDREKNNSENDSSNEKKTGLPGTDASASQREDNHIRASITEVKKSPGTSTGTGNKAKYSFQIGDLQVYVYKESITEIKGMDAVVNAANDVLMHGGGVAYYISKAAGKKMDQECKDYITRNGNLQVTECFVSNPGEMKCKGIIHAVGPKWYDYKEKKDDCARHLYETIKNVLIAGNGKKWQKIALSAISSGLFGVPKKLCAEMYILAFADFASKGGGTVQEVHFIDVNREILDLVIDAHKNWIQDESKLSFKNALDYTTAVSKQSKREEKRSDEGDCFIKFCGSDVTSYGATRCKYLVCGKVTVFVYQGSLTRLEKVDAIGLTISPDRSNIGVLEQSVRYYAGSGYTSEVDKFRNGKKGNVFVSKKTGKLKCKNIVNIISSPVRRLDEASLANLCEIYRLALTQTPKLRSLGMPLFGTGALRYQTDIQYLCGNFIQTLVAVSTDSKMSLKVEEFHLVNLEPLISRCLQEEFKRLSDGTKVVEMGKNDTARSDYKDTMSVSPGKGHWIQHTPLDGSSAPVADEKSNSEVKKPKNLKTEKAPSGVKCVYCDKQASLRIKGCSHAYCTACKISAISGNICLTCSKMPKDNMVVNSKTPDENCPICLETIKQVEELPCSHKLCGTCYQNVKKNKPQCPVCQHIFGEVTGTQPDGEMSYRHVAWKSLPGFEKCGTIDICFFIPPGKQKGEHPHPGKSYEGIERRAYLPDNKEGNEILHLFRRAFDRKLMFTIGASRTTGKEDVVTYNDIHLKTKQTGGPDRFGYPDPTYMTRVREELAAKGVTD